MEIGRLHVVMIHLPIGLAMAAVLAEGLWGLTKRAFFAKAGLYCLILAAATAIPAVVTGHEHLENEAYTGTLAEIAETHEALGFLTLTVLIAAVAVRLLGGRLPRWVFFVVYVPLLVGVAALVTATGHYGGMLTHGVNYLAGG